MNQEFYVLYNIEKQAYYDDGTLTLSPLNAHHYQTAKEASEELKYFYTPKEWLIKKVTLHLDIRIAEL